MSKKKYKIVRFFKGKPHKNKVVKSGVSLDEGREHCEREDTRGWNWFDGFMEDK